VSVGLIFGPFNPAEVVECVTVACCCNHPNLRGWSMGDKSPKSTERKKKQDSAAKNQKKIDAYTKAHPAPVVPGKKGK
jgi:hypothetical protein